MYRGLSRFVENTVIWEIKCMICKLKAYGVGRNMLEIEQGQREVSHSNGDSGLGRGHRPVNRDSGRAVSFSGASM